MYARSGTVYPRSDRFDHVLQLLRDTVTPAFLLIYNGREGPL
jgi:hypothetical protein